MIDISEVRVSLVDVGTTGRVKAFVSCLFDHCFCVQDMKIIERDDGSLLLAMPDRLLADRCPFCKSKNPYRNRHCGFCGARIDENRCPRDPETGRHKAFQDIAYPITSAFRNMLETRVLSAYKLAVEFENDDDRVCCVCNRELYMRDVVNLRGVHLTQKDDKYQLCCAGECWQVLSADTGFREAV